MQSSIQGSNYLFGFHKGFQGGKNIWLESGVKLNIGKESAKITLNDHIYINSYTILDCQDSINIGNRVQIGPHCYIGDFDHNVNVDIRLSYHRSGGVSSPIIIEDNVWIGAGVCILKGVRVGRNSVIAAGSVVLNDIPPNVLAAGVPCTILKNIEGNIDDEMLRSMSTL